MYSAYLKWLELIKGERKKYIYIKLLTYFLCDNIWSENVFSIIKLVFRGKREFCLFYYNVILKDRVLFKQAWSSIEIDGIVVKKHVFLSFLEKVRNMPKYT